MASQDASVCLADDFVMRRMFRVLAWMMRTGKSGLLAAVLTILLSPVAGAVEGPHLLLLLSEQHAPYQRFRQSFEQGLSGKAHLEVRTLDAGNDLPHADLLVTVGSQAAEWAFQHARAPLLATMLSSDAYLRMSKASRKGVSALYLDQPLSRQIALIRAALPDRARVGVLYSPGSDLPLGALRQEAVQQGAQLMAQPVQKEQGLAVALESLLGQSDVLMALPDNDIYNSYTIRNILLGSYRRNVPLVGLSAAYVNAGALCALYSTVEQQGEQAAEMVNEFLASRRLPAPQFPRDYQIAVNADVARSLGLSVPSLDVLRRKIEEGRRSR